MKQHALVVIYRRASPADRGSIESLLTSNQLPCAGALEHLGDFWLAFTGEQLIGVAGIERHGRFGLLRSVAVKDGFRNAGIARNLVERVVGVAGAHGLSALYLLTVSAATYFERLGFRRIERALAPDELQASEEFRGACPAGATLMRLEELKRELQSTAGKLR